MDAASLFRRSETALRVVLYWSCAWRYFLNAGRHPSKSNFSESKTKLAHVNAFIGINALADEKEKQLRRLNYIVRREEAYSEQECLYVAGCLAIGNPMMISVLPHRN